MDRSLSKQDPNSSVLRHDVESDRLIGNRLAAPCDNVIMSARVAPIGLCHLEFDDRTLDLH